MGALLHQPAVLQHEHHVGSANGGEPVSDDECGPADHQPVERVENDVLGARVDRRGRLVQDQDRRALEERPRDADALTLTAREHRAALAEPRPIRER